MNDPEQDRARLRLRRELRDLLGVAVDQLIELVSLLAGPDAECPTLVIVAAKDEAPNFEDQGPARLAEPTGEILLAAQDGSQTGRLIEQVIEPTSPAGAALRELGPEEAHFALAVVTSLERGAFVLPLEDPTRVQLGSVVPASEQYLSSTLGSHYFVTAFLNLAPTHQLGRFVDCALRMWLGLVVRSLATDRLYGRRTLKLSATEVAMRACEEFVRNVTRPGNVSDLFESLRSPFSQFNAIASAAYESKEANGLLHIVKGGPVDLVVELVPPVPLNQTRRVRKLLHGARTHLALVASEDQVIGYVARQKLLEDVAVTISFRARGAWTLLDEEGDVLVEIVEGRPKEPTNRPEVRVARALCRRFPLLPDRVVTAISGAVLRNRRAREGAIFVVTQFADEELERLGSQATGTEKALPTVETLSELSQVDGAVLLGDDGLLRAFGVILDGLCGQAETSSEGAGIPLARGRRSLADASRGARFNSAVLYSQAHRKTYGQRSVCVVVLSEDGMLNFFPTGSEWRVSTRS